VHFLSTKTGKSSYYPILGPFPGSAKDALRGSERMINKSECDSE
jgi:hypothetical protein